MNKAIRTSIILSLSIVAMMARADTVGDVRSKIKQYSNGFKDMKATVTVLQSNRSELEKMGSGFAESYQFKKADILFKSPDNLKMSGALGMTKIEFITTSAVRVVRAPSIRMKKREDISGQYEKRVTTLDIGLATDSIWNTYTVTLDRTEKNASGAPVYVLKLTVPTSERPQMVWVDGQTMKVLRRDKINWDGKLRAKILYSGHKQMNGVWVPTKAEVYNGDGKLAAITETKDIAVNTGATEKDFE